MLNIFNRFTGVLLLFFVVLFFAVFFLGADDWERWRGPEGTGISSETELNPASLSGSPKILMRTNVGSGYSSMTIKGSYLYTMGNDGKRDTVYCMNARTGAVVWHYSYPCGTGDYPGPRVTPTIDGTRVYTLSRRGQLFCFEASNGKIIWKKDIVKEYKARRPGWDFAGSPIIEGNMLILNANTSGLSLDKKTGKTIWKSSPGTGGYATPVLFNYGSRRVAVFFGWKALYAVDALTGKVLWSYPWVTSCDVNAADPIIIGNKIFISSGYNKGCAMLELKDGKPKLLWKNKKMRNHFSSSIYLNGYIYGNDGQAGSGTYRCIDARTGKEMWSKKLGTGSLISAAGMLILLNEKSSLFIIKATHTSYQEISSCKVLGPTCWTPPALSGGLIYCRNVSGDLVCVDVRK